jgi:hypothetical protein
MYIDGEWGPGHLRHRLDVMGVQLQSGMKLMVMNYVQHRYLSKIQQSAIEANQWRVVVASHMSETCSPSFQSRERR